MLSIIPLELAKPRSRDSGIKFLYSIMASYGGYIYMLTDDKNEKLYIGVTSNLIARISSHLLKVHPRGYAGKHGLTKLVFYELHDRIEFAIGREKQLKGWRREKKNRLIKMINPKWTDLITDKGDAETYPEIAELPIDFDTRGDDWW